MKNIGGISILILLCFFAFCPVFSGCSGSGGAGGGEEKSGAVRLSLQWPDGGKSRLIPGNTDRISVAIYKNDLVTEVGSAEIPYGQSSVTINEIPAGQKVVQIKALNLAGETTALRRQPVSIISGGTTDAGNLPLGIAVTDDGQGGEEIEPSSINVASGQNIYIQNWTSNDYEVKSRNILTGAQQDDFSLAGSLLSQSWSFPGRLINVTGNMEAELYSDAAPLGVFALFNTGWSLAGFNAASANVDNRTYLPSWYYPTYLISGDFNLDGKMDMAGVAYRGTAYNNRGFSLHVYMNNGDGSFTSTVYVLAERDPIELRSGDFNGDGYPDIVVGTWVTTTETTSRAICVFMNRGVSGVTGNFSDTVGTGQFTYQAGGYGPRGLVCVDFNLDGYDDIITNCSYANSTATLNSNNLTVFLSKGQLNPVGGPFTTAAGYYYTYQGHGYKNRCTMDTGDFNRDGYPDIVLGNEYDSSGVFTNKITVFLNKWGQRSPADRLQYGPLNDTLNNGSNGGGRFDYTSGAYWTAAVSAADFNNDGYSDIVVTHRSTNSAGSAGTNLVSVFMNMYGGIENPDQNSSPFGLTAGAGRYDITMPQYSPWDVKTADFNGDGFADIATGCNSLGALSEWNTGSTLFVALNRKTPGNPFSQTEGRYSITTGSGPDGLAIGDYSGDGKPDIGVAVSGTAGVKVHIQQ